MIAHLSGVIAEKFGAGSVVVDVHGVGYEVSVAAGDFEAVVLNQDVKFYTYHHVREQAEELFGFSSLAAKKLFEMLITVQSVGPKAALAILSLGDAEQVRNAIANERVVVDLSDKVGLPAHYGRADTPVQTKLNTSDEALEALMALGYTLADATKALENVDTNLPTAQRVTMALKS